MLRKIGVALGIAVFLLVGIGGMVSVQEVMPPHAIVAVYENRYYPNNHSILAERLPNVRILDTQFMTVANARRNGCLPDEVSREQDGFVGAGYSLLWDWLGRFGIPVPSRWNPDGTWRW